MEKTIVIRTEGKFIEDLPSWGWTSSKSKFVPSDDVTAIRFYLPEHHSTFFLMKGNNDEYIFDGVPKKIDFEKVRYLSFLEIEKIFFPDLDFDEEEIEEFVQKTNLSTFQS